MGRTFIDSPVASGGAFSRAVVIDTGEDNGVMTIDLEKTEQEHFQFTA